MSVTVFGGGAVQTAYVSFTALDVSLNDIHLVWPTSYFDVPSVVEGIHYNVLAASFTVNNSNLNDFSIILPDAKESGIGSNFIIKNIGVRALKVYLFDGVTELLLIPNAPNTSNSFWVQLIDNSTQNGMWQSVQFGAGTSQAQAAALAGNGLVALGGLLNTNIVVEPINNSPYQVLITDRAKLILWQTGAGNMVLPLIATVPSGFYISVNNEGGGILTIAGNASIDNNLDISVAPGQSLSIISDGAKWWTLGFGQNIASSNFAPGSSLAPSITFTNDVTTGIYYYQTPFPPATPPGIGFSVSSSQIANLTTGGLYMNAGKNIIVQDSTNVAQATFSADASYTQIGWINGAATPYLRLTGTNINSTLTLGPFGTLSFAQSDLAALVNFNANDIWLIDAAGSSAFINSVGFQNTTIFTLTATFNGPIISNNTVTFNNPISIDDGANINGIVVFEVDGTVTFNGTSTFADTATFNQPAIFNNSATFNGSVTLTNPLPIGDGGTGQNTRALAINALLPAAPPIGSMIYYDNTGNWILVSPGVIGETLTLVDDGVGNPVPKWV